MKPEYIGIGNFDENNYVYAYCKCPLPTYYAIKWPRIKDGKPHTYTCTCENCGTEVGVISKSYGPEILTEIEKGERDNMENTNNEEALKALYTIKETCKNHGTCDGCPLYFEEDKRCIMKCYSAPYCYPVKLVPSYKLNS